MLAAGDRLFLSMAALFNGAPYDVGTELWSSDGTLAGTHLVTDLRPGWNDDNTIAAPLSSGPHELTALLDDWRRALDQPVLTLTDLPAPPAGQPRSRPGRSLSHAEVVSRLGLAREGR